MKLIAEVDAWRKGAAAKFGDPAVPVCQLFVRFAPTEERLSNRRPELFAFRDGDEIVLRLGSALEMFFYISVIDGALGFMQVNTFTAEQISAGVWALMPSLNVRGVLHGFVVLYDVPNPAPWQRAYRRLRRNSARGSAARNNDR